MSNQAKKTPEVGLVTEVQEDGSEVIVNTDRPTNYDMDIKRLDTEIPDTLPTGSLSKLFKPKYVLEVTAEDGTIIPFVYKKIDPATLLATHGEALAVDIEAATTAQKEIERLRAESNQNPDINITDVSQSLNNDTMSMIKTMIKVRKLTVQTGVISPEITDEIYEELDFDIIDALEQAISGGVTNQNELVKHFHKRAEASKQSNLLPVA